MIEALDVQVRGIVQGVGFRPFVYRAAKKYLINGWVLNTSDGVSIHAEGEGKLLDEFVLELSEHAPAAAQVREIELTEVPLQDCGGFEIRTSGEEGAEETTLVSADLATCDDCLHELLNPNDRRYRYPFINCTNCGPRFTIIDGLPYDRPRTSMRDFSMCSRCAAEYDDPADRRFHAQPDACFDCGPSLTWWEVGNAGFEVARGRERSDAALARAVELLRAGSIVAVKGLGGFHLVCDARNAAAVARLRAGKRRGGKPFAVMARSTADARAVCEVSDEEAAVLEGPQRPIVLLRKRPDAERSLAPGLADRLPELGIMLPSTPVQHLLLHDFAAAEEAEAGAGAGKGVHGDALAPAQRPGAVCSLPPMLVMTSGNIHDEPIVVDDEEAREKLAGIADAVLGNNRAILSRYDDSVVRLVRAGSAGPAIQMIRRARGYAPVPLALNIPGPDGTPAPAPAPAPAPDGAPAPASAPTPTAPVLFAAGSEQKSTCTFVRGAQAFVSQHVGDVENAETLDAWLAAKARLEGLFRMSPAALAADAHPDYLTSKWARDQARSQGLPLTEVQHHHAHVASVLGEHGLYGPVCGIAFDGTGYGLDGAIWGGEVLLANAEAFERFANFAYIPLPGGAAAVKHPLRTAYGALWAFDLLDHPGASAALAQLSPEQAELCGQMIDRGLNTPFTSSVGRLFDAASALLGVCTEPTYEGEAAILLEAAIGEVPETPEADEAAAQRYQMEIVKNTATASSTAQDTSALLIDAAPVFRALLDDLAGGVGVPVIARRFHDAFVRIIADMAEVVRRFYGLSTVALSGGVFMNRYLLEHVLALMEEKGFTVAVNRDLPPNDGCLSFGQAVVACAQNRPHEPKE